MASRLRAVAREPLAHFVLAGVAIFALERLVAGPAATRADASPSTAPAPVASAALERRLVVDAKTREFVTAEFVAEHARPPGDAELAERLERWATDEILFREGLARGLDRDDPRVRERIVAKMAYVAKTTAEVPEPTQADLAAWLEAHRARFEKPELVDFVHVFVAGPGDEAARAKAAELLELVRGGASPDGLGDRFSGGRRYRKRKPADLAQSFGDEFAKAVASQPIGGWALAPSKFGYHAVRVDARSAGSSPALADVEADVRHDWRAAREEAAAADAVAKLRAGWQVVVAP